MIPTGDGTQAWHALVTTLERLLYDHDPDGMGASVSAPLDEYHDVAVAVTRVLRARREGQSLENAVLEIVPNAGTDLLRDITKVWNGYRAQDQEA